MSVYELSRTLRNEDVNMHRQLRTSALFRMMQEAAVAHTEELGAGRALTLDRGLLWMVTLQYAKVFRMPEYDEPVTLKSWPGETMHVLFPRYFTMSDEKGRPLVSASALWTLVDAKTRRMVFPERCGVRVEGVVTGEEAALPKPLPKTETENGRPFSVPFSYVDLNGHMNNTRYFDLAEDSIDAPAAGKQLREIRSEYIAEALLGEELSVGWKKDGDGYFVSGKSGDKRIFSIEMKYE